MENFLQEIIQPLQKQDEKMDSLSFWQSEELIQNFETFCQTMELNQTVKNLKIEACFEVSEEIQEKSAKLIEKMIEKNKSIIQLDLHSNHFNDSSICSILNGLLKNSTVKKLDLNQNDFGEQSYQKLGELLMQNHTIEDLNLGITNLSDEGIISLSKIFPFNKSLKIIDLRSNGITSKGAEIFFQSLIQNKVDSIIDISFAFNPVMDSYQQISNWIEINNNISSLNLTGIPFTCDEFEPILASLSKLPSLKILKMSGIKTLKEKGGSLIANFLSKNQSIEHILIGSCSLGDEGLKEIFTILSSNLNQSLKILDAPSNYISDLCTEEIAKAIKENPVIEVINVNGNFITGNGARIIIQALKQKKNLKQCLIDYNSIDKDDSCLEELKELNGEKTKN
ncbi:leucine rich repeat family protein [Anaeramoeba ignava]|uniref:Leucine rich repeat family protein n=1 Tax=Anaeramoeba ignava TaxID=1746090 RepID=A0A9Q0RAW3_ANAIG|nr:leucine rich repeat family protein [Anaeramoeba ignava]